MEEEKKMVENTPEENKTEEKAEPVITQSMREEACPTCGATEPSMPAVLPDMSWSIEKLIAATKGRASYVGERSIGHEDPGAVSSMVMFRAMYSYLKK